ncbi:response regulator receiver, ANTAR domain-containing protein [Gordonia sp. KTR9] [Mycobacterium shimoidei]|uniref:Response regulator receiver, ANTAR domain-containing protein [Gordonia sp. KTR9] n=1 Tax=Mycobacterium shimoidei TaxID=29313 RepID=A0A375YYR9_MYCSH|nr:GAF and ANTAR domain-containing protein [Mycobacterium shimoidei]SRX93840.1 response regulator receiver, ANTAR domain-containing protein [Gordonia sp. KTR9] [Mycobacterium shimoidei]
MAPQGPSGHLLEVAELAQALQQQSMDVDFVLAELIENAVQSVPAAQYAGITTVFRDGTVQTTTATGPYPEILDDIQQRHCEGPCLSAAWEHHIIRIGDMACDTRWPSYSRDAAEETPIRSAMLFQLYTNRQTMGALNFYAEQREAFDDDAAELGLILATHAALAWNLVRRDEQFRSALASRDVIGQAKGILMERFGIDAVHAFELLKRLSQRSNTPLIAVARQLVESKS